ncbi:MAG: sialidase family protein [Hyphomicrobium sp.]
MPLGDGERQISRPFVLADGDAVYLAYKTFDGERTTIDVMVSHDAGKSWSRPWTAAVTAADSDHPQLVSDGRAVYLSWLSRKEGYRLIPLEAKS